MTALFKTRLTAVLLALIAATLLSWRFSPQAGRYATVIAILVAALKIRYVLLDFMELRAAPPLLRLACELWASALAAIIITLHWLGTAPS